MVKAQKVTMSLPHKISIEQKAVKIYQMKFFFLFFVFFLFGLTLIPDYDARSNRDFNTVIS